MEREPERSDGQSSSVVPPRLVSSPGHGVRGDSREAGVAAGLVAWDGPLANLPPGDDPLSSGGELVDFPDYQAGEVEGALLGSLELAAALHPEFPLDRGRSRALLEEARVLVEKGYGPASALAWAQDRGWEGRKSEVVDRDEAAFCACGLSIEVLARRLQEKMAPDRISSRRVEEFTRDDNPERSKLLLLCRGMAVTHAPDFVPNALGGWPPLSKSYRLNRFAVDCLLNESHKQGHGFFVRRSTLEGAGVVAHINPAGLVLADKPEGRMITNLSFGNPSLNSQWAKEWADDYYGIITHTDIDRVVRLPPAYLEAYPGTSEEDLVYLVMDIKSAFPRLNFAPEGVHLQGLGVVQEDVVDGVVREVDCAYFSLVGHFGSCQVPAAFQVVTRALLFEFRNDELLLALMEMFCDDILAICKRCDVEGVIARLSAIICGLLGPGSVAVKKTRFGRQVDGLGYALDLDTRLLRLSRKNSLKTVYAFFGVDEGSLVEVPLLQRLSSLASRLGKICRYVCPLTRWLYRAHAGRKQCARVPLDEQARTAIRVVRAILLLSLCSEEDGLTHFARPFDTFWKVPPRMLVDVDASLTGIGLLFYSLREQGEGEEEAVPLAHARVSIETLEFGTDSSFQNTAEYMGNSMVLRGLRLLGQDRGTVRVRQDSVSALAWAEKCRAKSDRGLCAGLAYVEHVMASQCSGFEFVHQAGVLHGLADSRSREGTLEDLGEEWKGVPELDLDAGLLVELCDPKIDLATQGALVAHLRKLRSEVRGVVRGQPEGASL
jgi:hypothetical protein